MLKERLLVPIEVIEKFRVVAVVGWVFGGVVTMTIELAKSKTYIRLVFGLGRSLDNFDARSFKVLNR